MIGVLTCAFRVRGDSPEVEKLKVVLQPRTNIVLGYHAGGDVKRDDTLAGSVV